MQKINRNSTCPGRIRSHRATHLTGQVGCCAGRGPRPPSGTGRRGNQSSVSRGGIFAAMAGRIGERLRTRPIHWNRIANDFKFATALHALKTICKLCQLWQSGCHGGNCVGNVAKVVGNCPPKIGGQGQILAIAGPLPNCQRGWQIGNVSVVGRERARWSCIECGFPRDLQFLRFSAIVARFRAVSKPL